MASTRTLPPIESPSSTQSQRVWANDDLRDAVQSVNLSFRREEADEDVVDGYASDEIELFLPDDLEPPPDPIIREPARMHSSSVGLTLRWAAQRLLTIDEQVRLDAARALLSMRSRRGVEPASVQVESSLADNLSNIFTLGNIELQRQAEKDRKELAREQDEIVRQAADRRERFRRDAEASIAEFLAEQKRVRDAEERRQREQREADEKRLREDEQARAEAARREEERRAKDAREEAARAAEAQQQRELDAQSAAVEQDTTTLFPIRPLRTASSLQRFCLRRAELFRTTHSLVNQAPFDPDKKQFLQVSQVLGRFVPVEDDVSRLVADLSRLLNHVSHNHDLHFCSLATSFLKQVQNKVFQAAELALGFALLWSSLGKLYPRLSLFVMAGVFARCPPAALALDEPAEVPSGLQASTLRALLRVFTCFLQLSDESGYEFCWMWLSAVVSRPPTTLTALCVLMFLETAELHEFKWFQRYGQQGAKLVRYIATTLLPALPACPGSPLSSDLSNLNTFLDRAVLRSRPGRAYILRCINNT
ncbi:mRNA export factor GLE1 [Plasmodiophora brassicae]